MHSVNIVEDLKHKSIRYFGDWSLRKIYRTLRTDGTSAVILYRMSQFLQKRHLGILAVPVRYMNRLLNSCWIGKNASFGKGLVIMHPYGLVVNSNVTAGENVVIQSGVVIGVAKDGTNGVPIIGNNVYFGSGAKVIGDLRIGNNVLVGANSVVLKDIPDNSTVIGIPGRILKNRIRKRNAINIAENNKD